MVMQIANACLINENLYFIKGKNQIGEIYLPQIFEKEKCEVVQFG